MRKRAQTHGTPPAPACQVLVFQAQVATMPEMIFGFQTLIGCLPIHSRLAGLQEHRGDTMQNAWLTHSATTEPQ